MQLSSVQAVPPSMQLLAIELEYTELNEAEDACIFRPLDLNA